MDSFPPDFDAASELNLRAASPRAGGGADGFNIAVVVGGHGRVGKTTVSNTLVQFCRANGATLEVWNADRQNETHSLNSSMPTRCALRPMIRRISGCG